MTRFIRLLSHDKPETFVWVNPALVCRIDASFDGTAWLHFTVSPNDDLPVHVRETVADILALIHNE
jgi:hypothetical protein